MKTMKSLIMLTALAVATLVTACSENRSAADPETVNELEKVYKKQNVDVSPEFPGGQEAMMAYFQENLKYPDALKEKGLEGKVFVQFTVSKTGEVTDVKVLKGADPAMDEQAKKFVSEMPDWTPGKKDGEPVNVEYVLPVSYQLN